MNVRTLSESAPAQVVSQHTSVFYLHMHADDQRPNDSQPDFDLIHRRDAVARSLAYQLIERFVYFYIFYVYANGTSTRTYTSMRPTRTNRNLFVCNSSLSPASARYHTIRSCQYKRVININDAQWLYWTVVCVLGLVRIIAHRARRPLRAHLFSFRIFSSSFVFWFTFNAFLLDAF